MVATMTMRRWTVNTTPSVMKILAWVAGGTCSMRTPKPRTAAV